MVRAFRDGAQLVDRSWALWTKLRRHPVALAIVVIAGLGWTWAGPNSVDLSEGSVAVSSADGVFTALAANVSERPVALATADFDTIYFAVPDATAVADVGAARCPRSHPLRWPR
jgi:hypothetical protein